MLNSEGQQSKAVATVPSLQQCSCAAVAASADTLS